MISCKFRSSRSRLEVLRVRSREVSGEIVKLEQGYRALRDEIRSLEVEAVMLARPYHKGALLEFHGMAITDWARREMERIAGRYRVVGFRHDGAILVKVLRSGKGDGVREFLTISGALPSCLPSSITVKVPFRNL